MRCPKCGSEIPEASKFCVVCGAETEVEYSESKSLARFCVSCGRAIPFDVNVCPFCSHDYSARSVLPVPHADISTLQRFLLYVVSIIIPIAGIIIGAIYYGKQEPEYKHVGKICLILGVVCIFLVPVVLSAVLYVMVLGFGGTGTQAPTTSLAKKTPGPDFGVKYEFVSISKDTGWSDITIQLSDGTTTVQWAPLTADLDNGTTAKYVTTARTLGTLTVWCNITDLVGNGYVNGGDFLTFTTARSPTFSLSTTYTIGVIYDPTTSKIYDTTFTG